MEKSITLILTIMIAASLLPFLSPTANAAVTSDDMPYVLYTSTNGSTGVVIVSSQPFVVLRTSSGGLYGLCAVNPTAGKLIRIYRMGYSEPLGAWEAVLELPDTALGATYYRYGGSTSYASGCYHVLLASSGFASQSIVTNCTFNASEQALFGSYSNDLSNLPQGLTEEQIKDMINGTTDVTTQANTIITNTTNVYNDYKAGTVDSATLQQTIDANTETLNTLSQTSGATIADLVAVNNAMTYNQTVQDALIGMSSAGLRTQIDTIVSDAEDTYSGFRNQLSGYDQENCIRWLRSNIMDLQALITNGTASTTADIEAVKSGIDSCTFFLDAIQSVKELDAEVSEAAQASDAAEKAYLEGLEAETTQSISQLSPSDDFDSGAIADANSILAKIWDNEFIVKLVGISACFMVVSVALGIKYRL